jgi:MFS family permease
MIAVEPVLRTASKVTGSDRCRGDASAVSVASRRQRRPTFQRKELNGERVGQMRKPDKGHTVPSASQAYYGWRIVAAVFVLATFGWGVGFYGPPIFLHAVIETRGWPLALVSTAVTVHFVFGALVVANLPNLYRRFGISAVTKMGCIALATGTIGWAIARQPWQLFLATLLSGTGWATMGAAAVNAIIAPWFVKARPAALASAYNGASIGGVVFSPLWVAAIDLLGFADAAVAIGLVMVATMWALADVYFSKKPEDLALAADGNAPGALAASVISPFVKPLPGNVLWRDRSFITLAGGMALGLFAQIGLLAPLVFAPGAGARRASRRARRQRSVSIGNCGAHAIRLADAHRRRSEAVRVGELRGADRRLPGIFVRGRTERAAVASGRRVVRFWHRQWHLPAASDRASRVRERRRCPCGSDDRRRQPRNICIRAGGVRADPRIRAAGGRGNARSCAVSIPDRRGNPGRFDWVLPARKTAFLTQTSNAHV